eukprot:3941613-Rhodomonas_salina.5
MAHSERLMTDTPTEGYTSRFREAADRRQSFRSHPERSPSAAIRPETRSPHRQKVHRELIGCEGGGICWDGAEQAWREPCQKPPPPFRPATPSTM